MSVFLHSPEHWDKIQYYQARARFFTVCGFLWTSVVILCALALCAHMFSVQHHLVSGHLNPWTKLFTLFPTSVVSENNQIGELRSQGHLCCWTQQKPSELLLTQDCSSHRWHLWGCMSMMGIAKTKTILFTEVSVLPWLGSIPQWCPGSSLLNVSTSLPFPSLTRKVPCLKWRVFCWVLMYPSGLA